MKLPAPDDHAFASGFVFPEPASLWRAWRWTEDLRQARLLCAIWRQFHNSAQIRSNVRLGLKARLINLAMADSAVTIGADAVVRAILRNEPKGSIAIGANVYLGDDVIISAASQVSVGAGTLIAHGAQIFDNDTHPLDPEERARHFDVIQGKRPGEPLSIATRPISIGKNCWIGMNALVMKGVTIGNDAIVAAGSVVVNDVPSRSIVAGNPAVALVRPVRSERT